MAFESDAKTEAPTPRRRQEARSKGQVARSQDLPAAVLLFVGLWTLYLLGPGLWQSLTAIVRAGLILDGPPRLGDLLPMAGAIGAELLRRIGPLLLILFAVVIAVLYAQVGLMFTFQPLMPSLSKINPLEGIKRLFSVRSVMLALISVGKLLIVAGIVYLTIASRADAILFAFTLGFQDVFVLGASLAFQLGMRLATALIVLALIDYVWQRYRHEKDLRMTKEEVKDELRSMEGDPKMKARRRQIQFQLAMQRLKKAVPRADVIITNPTHLAIAIQYDSKTMMAPKVVAKGADYLALRIRQIAADHGIPIVERKPLARALYEVVEVGQYIPERFYRAIAEILAYIYELTGRPPIQTRRELIGA